MADELRQQLETQAQRQDDTRQLLQRQARPVPEREGPLGRNPIVQEGLSVGRQFAQGALEVLNIPMEGVDAIAGIMGYNIPRGPRLFDFQPPESRMQQASNVMGQSSIAALPVVGHGLRGLRAGQAATGPVGAMTQEVARSAATQPARFAATELSAAAGAGAAGWEAERLWPDSPAAKAFAELGGGFAGGVAPFALGQAANVATGVGASLTTGVPFAGQLIRRAGQSVREFLTPQGAFRRAQRRIRRASPDAEEMLRRAEEADVLPDAPLTIPQRAGDRGPLALERSVMESNPRLSQRRQEKFTEVNRAIRESLEQELSPRRVDPQQAREYLNGMLDTRISQAMEISDQRLRELAPTATREDANRIAGEELRRVRNVANRQETQLYDNLPFDLPTPTDQVRIRYEHHKGKLTKARRKSMPDVARELLDRESPDFLGQTTNFAELHGLRGELREVARIARSEGRNNQARIADDIADTVVDDLSNVSTRNMGESLRRQYETAIAFSRDKNDRFNRGDVGRLLGTNRDGGDQVPTDLTLETTIGRSGPRARVATDALLEAVRRHGNEEVMRSHIEDFLKDQFNRATVRIGRAEGRRIDSKAGAKFMRDNEDVLARFDGVRRQFRQAIQSGETVELLERVTDSRVSRAAIFLNASPGREMDRILSSKEPARAVRDVIELAGRDPEGLATDGLRTAFLQRVLQRSEARARDLMDDPFTSGRHLERELSSPAARQIMEELYSQEGRRKLQTIVNTARRLDDARESPEAVEGILGDTPGVVTAIASRYGGAQFGNWLARNFGGANIQTPAIFSAAFQNAARRGVSDPGTALLTEAMDGGNPDLFRSLVLDASGSSERQDFVRTQLNAWLASVGADPLAPEDIENERMRLEQLQQDQRPAR